MSDPCPLHSASQQQLRALCVARDAGAQAALSVAFHTVLAQHRADLLDDLFPALREAVAGSDPVCIRDMQAWVVAQLDDLERAWCSAVDGAAPAPNETPPVQRACERLLDYERAELWPMAERLLDAPAWAALVAAQQARRRGRRISR